MAAIYIGSRSPRAAAARGKRDGDALRETTTMSERHIDSFGGGRCLISIIAGAAVLLRNSNAWPFVDRRPCIVAAIIIIIIIILKIRTELQRAQ